MENLIKVEYLYLDLNSCDRCIGTDNVLDDVMKVLTPALKIAGYEVVYNKVEMKNEELAGEYKFVSSPTIRVNGKDICQSVAENNCGCCSDISGTDVDCRVFEYQGVKYEVPPKEMIASSILQAVFGQTEKAGSNEHYTIPKNLKVFYKGKKSKSECSCGSSCC
jgi:glutaredoxin